jgi:hypothetical protein
MLYELYIHLFVRTVQYEASAWCFFFAKNTLFGESTGHCVTWRDDGDVPLPEAESMRSTAPLPEAESTKSAPLHGLVLRRQHHGWIPREACARVISPPISEQLQPGEREDGSPALAPAPAPPRRLKVHRREAPLRPCAGAMLQLR